jgi:hypothetical protein
VEGAAAEVVVVCSSSSGLIAISPWTKMIFFFRHGDSDQEQSDDALDPRPDAPAFGPRS